LEEEEELYAIRTDEYHNECKSKDEIGALTDLTNTSLDIHTVAKAEKDEDKPAKRSSKEKDKDDEVGNQTALYQLYLPYFILTTIVPLTVTSWEEPCKTTIQS
jgi:hypothetical protein